MKTTIIGAVVLIGLGSIAASTRSCETCLTNDDCSDVQYCSKDDGDCLALGTCETKPQICFDVWTPVCGCDGNTYSNTCYAARAGVCVFSEGECRDIDSQETPLTVSTTPPTFTRLTVDCNAKGAAYATIADMDGDGNQELVVSQYNTMLWSVTKGWIDIYKSTGGLDHWTKSSVFTTSASLYFPNQTTVEDIDGDGDMDLVVPHGFLLCELFFIGRGPCGGIAWFEQRSTQWVRHNILGPKSRLFYTSALLVDVDNDGIKDLVTVGERMKVKQEIAQWFKGNTSADRFAKTPMTIGEGLGSFPQLHDVDNDGDLDLLSAEYFMADAGFAWFERLGDPSSSAPAGLWQRHVIASDTGPSIQISIIPNLFGDGVTRAVGANHANRLDYPNGPKEALYLFDLPDDPTTSPWPNTVISTTFASRKSMVVFFPVPGWQSSPGVFGYGDIDGDGDIDLAVSGDGDPRLFWFEQLPGGTFAEHVLDSNIGEASGMKIVDLDGDGQNEIVVTSYDNNAVYIYTQQI